MVKIDEEVQCKHLLYWSGEHRMGPKEDDQQKLKNYWERFENYIKPHSNELIAAWEPSKECNVSLLSEGRTPSQGMPVKA